MGGPIEPTVLYSDDECLVAIWRRLVVQCWRRTQAAALDEAGVRLKPFLVVSEAPIASLVIFERDAAPAEGRARRQLDALDEALQPRCAATAYVYPGRGFRAAAARALRVALMTLGGRRGPTRVCATVDEALAFLAPHLADEVSFGTADERAAAVDAVWARFAAHETGAARAG